MAKTAKQLLARTKVLATTAKKLENDIHSHMVDITAFIIETGNVTPVADLMNMMPSGVRRDAMANWFVAFSGVNLSKDDETGAFKATRNKKIPADQIDLDAARSESPWTFTKEPEWKQFDLNKAIAALLKRAEDKLGEDVPEGSEGHKIDADKLAALKALAA